MVALMVVAQTPGGVGTCGGDVVRAETVAAAAHEVRQHWAPLVGRARGWVGHNPVALLNSITLIYRKI
jgi:cell wall-associated NlpC family hydrolase